MKILDQKTKNSIVTRIALGTEATFAIVISLFTAIGEILTDTFDFGNWKAEREWLKEHGEIPAKHCLDYHRGKCYLRRISDL